ncbi:hypothetical protein FFLO_06017 [Filobasidium floriforme]|uniref:40S ribosomal protein S27 n=1 Tax=Filobasidium floriforme TaxID=5210 RepID=A0A8K0JG89_9TREE|nr:hypothetical protein FFLO_06017 [Filobasidium floriforme]
MDVKCPGCFQITTVFSHASTVVQCGSCSTVLCQPSGGKAKLTEGESSPLRASISFSNMSLIGIRDIFRSNRMLFQAKAVNGRVIPFRLSVTPPSFCVSLSPILLMTTIYHTQIIGYRGNGFGDVAGCEDLLRWVFERKGVGARSRESIEAAGRRQT